MDESHLWQYLSKNVRIGGAILFFFQRVDMILAVMVIWRKHIDSLTSFGEYEFEKSIFGQLLSRYEKFTFPC